MKNVRRSKTANKHHKKRDEIRRLLFTNEYFEIEASMTFFMRVFYDVYSEVLTGL